MTLNKILAIEDDYNVRQLLVDIGSGVIQGPETIEAAFDLVRTNEYQIILIDRNLDLFGTKTKGDQIVAAIRSGEYGTLNQNKEIYSISGDVDGSMKGATGHIRKPDELFSKLMPLVKRYQ